MMKLLSGKIKDILIGCDYKLAVSESLTCGYIQKAIGQVSGASTFFEGGVTTYSLNQKCSLLSVDKTHAAAVNCVSATVAEQMASGTCSLFAVEVAIATTGYAEPDVDNDIDVPFAYVAVCIDGAIYSKKVDAVDRNRNEVQEYIATVAIEYLVECLTNN